jgi:threonine dehydrogenase-like Zn-dependent dehydrogenase
VVLIGSPGREPESRRVGCAAFVDYKAEDARQQALAVCATGFDYAIDVIGTGRTATLAHSCVADRGTLAIYGMDKVDEIVLKPNGSLGTFTYHRGGYSEAEVHDTVCEMVRSGQLDPSVWVDEDAAFELADIEQAFAAIRARTQVKPLIRIHAE